MYLWVSKKIVTIRHTNQIICQEKWKKFRLWKMKVKVSLENSDKTSCFELRLFSNATRKFSVDFMNTFNVSGRSAQLWSLRRWKNRDYTTCPSDYIANLAHWVFCGNIGTILQKLTVYFAFNSSKRLQNCSYFSK